MPTCPGQQIGSLKSTQPNSTNGNATDGEDRPTPGTFGFDEPDDVLEQVRASKNTTNIGSQATGPSRPARYIRLTPAAPTTNGISVARHTAQVRRHVLLHDW